MRDATTLVKGYEMNDRACSQVPFDQGVGIAPRSGILVPFNLTAQVSLPVFHEGIKG